MRLCEVAGSYGLTGLLRRHWNSGEAQERWRIVILCLDSRRHGGAPKDGLNLALYLGEEDKI